MRARALFVTAVVAVAVACAWACLPDLVISQPPPPTVCGDGVITAIPGQDGGEECDPGPDASPQALVGCQGCRVTCSYGTFHFFDPSSGHCYFTEPTSVFRDAVAGCEDAGAHLVRFVSEAEVSLVGANAGSNYWIGLQSTVAGGDLWLPCEPTNEPGYTPLCPGCFAHVDAGSDIPALLDAGVRCVAGGPASIGLVPYWTQDACSVARNLVVCEREPVGTRTTACPPNACFTVAATTKRYSLTSTKLGANDAVEACKALGGRLVVFQSREEREQVGYEIGTQTVVPGAHDFWIGFSSDANGTWGWDQNATGLEPPPWASAASDAGSSRAYVSVAPGDVSSELAVPDSASDAGVVKHYAVCEH